MSGSASSPRLPTLRAEIADFVRFVLRPRPGPRLPGRAGGSGVLSDFLLNAPWWRLCQWALLLWLINLVIFAPLALSAAQTLGAQHRLNIHHLPWLTALIWAPIVEELCFRHLLRRPALLWWFTPLMAGVMVRGPGLASGLLLVVALLLALAPAWYPSDHRLRIAWSWPFRLRVGLRRIYPLLFHGVAIAFAAVHLFNFHMNGMELFLLPLLVLPQWATGLVLGWMRVRRGLGAAMALHAIFNGGPLLFIALILHYAPQLAGG